MPQVNNAAGVSVNIRDNYFQNDSKQQTHMIKYLLLKLNIN